MDDAIIGPYIGEEGYRIAVPFTPPSYPFTVTHIECSLFHGHHEDGPEALCNPDHPHQIEVFASQQLAPALPTRSLQDRG